MAEQAGRARGVGSGALRDAIDASRHEPERKDVLSSVERALRVLEAVAAAPHPLPAKAVSQQLSISLGTTYHVLHTLEHAGYVVRLGQGCFGLGGKVPALYRLFHDGFDVLPKVRPLLSELAVRAREDVYLAVLRGGEVVIVARVEGSQELHLDLGEGFTPGAHVTALGKVLLAATSDQAIEQYLDERRLEPLTRRTLVERRRIRRELQIVRELGVGQDLEELRDGCCCVAAPVRDTAGATVAAIGLSTPAARWRAERQGLVQLCRETGARASRALVAPRLPLPR